MPVANNKPQSQLPQNPPLKSWYGRWHNSGQYRLIHWGILLIILAIAWALLYTQIGDWAVSLTQPGISLRLAKRSAELSLDPQTSSTAVGKRFEVNIMLDTASTQVDGVDIYSLHYDPSILRVVDSLPSISGVQILPGKIMSLNAANIVDTKTGTIKFGQVAAGGSSFKGKGVLATINFEAIAPGSAFLKFDFNAGSTVDSNAAFRGKDQLARVVDGIYTVVKE